EVFFGKFRVRYPPHAGAPRVSSVGSVQIAAPSARAAWPSRIEAAPEIFAFLAAAIFSQGSLARHEFKLLIPADAFVCVQALQDELGRRGAKRIALVFR